MTVKELAKAWPDFADTHNISLSWIASQSATFEEANEIRENRDWWSDETIRDVLKFEEKMTGHA